MAIYKVCGVGEHGKFFDDFAYYNAINYIFNPEKAVMIGGSGISSYANAVDDMRDVAIRFGKDRGKRIRHSILAFEENEDVSIGEADAFAKGIIAHYAPEYQIVYAIHANTEHLHIHFVMNQISYIDGHRYDEKKKDYYDFWNHMKHVTHLPIHLYSDKQDSSKFGF